MQVKEILAEKNLKVLLIEFDPAIEDVNQWRLIAPKSIILKMNPYKSLPDRIARWISYEYKEQLNSQGYIYVSSSHSQNYVLIAGSKSSKIGVDLEKHSDILIDPELFFHSEECEDLLAHPEKQLYYWCAHEAYSKFTGTGVMSDWRLVSVIHPPQGICFRELNAPQGFTAVLCYSLDGS